jgi:hypothetical protein
MQLSTIFSRAWAQKYLEPGERALLKFANSLIIFVPSTTIAGGAVALLNHLQVSLPGWTWALIAMFLIPLLLGVAKWVTAQGDGNVGAAILTAEAAAAPLLNQQGPAAITMPQAPKTT